MARLLLRVSLDTRKRQGRWKTCIETSTFATIYPPDFNPCSSIFCLSQDYFSYQRISDLRKTLAPLSSTITVKTRAGTYSKPAGLSFSLCSNYSTDIGLRFYNILYPSIKLSRKTVLVSNPVISFVSLPPNWPRNSSHALNSSYFVYRRKPTVQTFLFEIA